MNDGCVAVRVACVVRGVVHSRDAAHTCVRRDAGRAHGRASLAGVVGAGHVANVMGIIDGGDSTRRIVTR